MRDDSKQFLLENWVFAFLAALVVLLVLSAALLDLGSTAVASQVATLTISALAAGMVVRTVIYLRHASARGASRSRVVMRYFRENWGAPFVLAFILLLATAALILSAGNSGSANDVAVYAFCALVLGVALQIASYVKYGSN